MHFVGWGLLFRCSNRLSLFPIVWVLLALGLCCIVLWCRRSLVWNEIALMVLK